MIQHKIGGIFTYLSLVIQGVITLVISFDFLFQHYYKKLNYNASLLLSVFAILALILAVVINRQAYCSQIWGSQDSDITFNTIFDARYSRQDIILQKCQEYQYQNEKLVQFVREELNKLGGNQIPQNDIYTISETKLNVILILVSTFIAISALVIGMYYDKKLYENPQKARNKKQTNQQDKIK